MGINMEIRLLTTEKATLTEEKGVYTINYNPLKFKQSSKVDLEITGIELKDISARPGCSSCTTVNVKKESDKVILSITYDTKYLGNFNKKVSFFHQGKLTTFKIVGIVTH